MRFWRASRWLSAAIALRLEDRSSIEAFVQTNVSKFIAKIHETQKTLLTEDQAVKLAGLTWIAALELDGKAVQPMASIAVLQDAESPELATKPKLDGPAKTSSLNAQAEPWPCSKIDVTPRGNREKEVDNVTTNEALPPVSLPAVVATEAKGGLAQGGAAVRLEPAIDATSPANGKGNSSSVNKTGPQIPDQHMGTSGGVEKKVALSPSMDDHASAWEKILAPRPAPKPDDKTPRSPIVQQPAEVMSRTPPPVQETTPAEQILAAPTAVQPIAAPDETVRAASDQVQQAVKLALEFMLAGMSDTSDEFGSYLTRVVQKALDNVNQEGVEANSAHGKGTQGAENVDRSVQASVETVDRSVQASAETVDRSVQASGDMESESLGEKPGADLNDSGLVQTAGNANNTSGFSTEKATATSSESFTVAPERATRHTHMDSLNARMQSLTIHDSESEYTAVAEQHNAGNGFGDPAKYGGIAGTTAHGAAEPKQAGAHSSVEAKLAEDDFWARAGITW